MHTDERTKLIGGGISLVVIVGLVWMAIARNNYEQDLITSGRCEDREEALYQPPPTYICSYRNSDGICLVHVPVNHEPYMRTHWRCELDSGEVEWFWRRKVYD